MITADSFSIIFVSIGSIFMLASIVASMKTSEAVPAHLQKKWFTMTCLMLFFLAGYVSFLVIQIAELRLPLELVTGSIFLGGASFTFLVTNLTRHTFRMTRETERQLSHANAKLLEKNAELELEIAARRGAEAALKKTHDELERQVQQRTRDLTRALDDLKQEVDIRKQTEDDLTFSYTELNQIFNSTSDGMAVIDTDFKIMRMNETLLSLLGTSRAEAVTRKCYEVLPGSLCNRSRCPLTRILEGEEKISYEISFDNNNGAATSFLVTTTPFKGLDGTLLGILQNFNDITERKQMEEKLREISMKDDLTGLLNRRGFIMKASQQLKIANRTHDDLFLLYADLDNMKWINDSFGHKAGDRVLVETASIFREAFRESDIIARIGGDEFAGLLVSPSGCDRENAILRRFEETLQKHNEGQRRPYDIHISTGIVRYDPMNPCATEELMTQADMLMYERKKQKKKPPLLQPSQKRDTGPVCLRLKGANRC